MICPQHIYYVKCVSLVIELPFVHQGTCFAGPRVEGGQIHAWWMVDIGQDHQVFVLYSLQPFQNPLLIIYISENLKANRGNIVTIMKQSTSNLVFDPSSKHHAHSPCCD